MDISRLAKLEPHRMPDDALRAAYSALLEVEAGDRRENQIRYYQPVSEHAFKVHESQARYVCIGGGNRASKTDTLLAELSALATGIMPDSVRHLLLPKFRGPRRIRIVIESLKTTLHPTILPKLQWFKWDGADMPGGRRGHWGWIPKLSLIGASWDRSWSEKLGILTVLCRDPDDESKMLGESTFQFMSHDQDSETFASGTFHDVLHDEPPKHETWRENEARVMGVGGRMLLSMTWPDDPAIPVDWIYDEVYEKGRPGPAKDPNYDWHELYALDNPNVDQDAIRAQAENWSDETRRVRIYGQPIRFAHRVHRLFTDTTMVWCFRCNDTVIQRGECCATCGSLEVCEFNHVKDFEHATWPCVFLLDPHPRKPHMFCWVAVDPSDDYWVVAEGEVEDDPTEVRLVVDEIEEALGLYTMVRIMDPNMGASPASARRGITWQDEFAEAGLPCMLGDDSDVGRKRVNEFLAPDKGRWQPRLHVHSRCEAVIGQIKRHVWDEYRKRTAESRDLKQIPKDKNDDYPTLLKYLMNMQPTFSMLRDGAPVIKTREHGRRDLGGTMRRRA